MAAMTLEKLIAANTAAMVNLNETMVQFMERQDGGALADPAKESKVEVDADDDGVELELDDDSDELSFDEDEDSDELSFDEDEEDEKEPDAITLDDVLGAFKPYVKAAQNKAEAARIRKTINPLLKAVKAERVQKIPEKFWPKAVQYGRILLEAYNEGGITAAEGAVAKAKKAISGK